MAQSLKEADAELGIDDPAAAAETLNAQTVSVTVDVLPSDLRAVLWRTFEYGKLDYLYHAGARGDFSAYPTVPGLTSADLFAAIATMLSFLGSDRPIRTDAEEDWRVVLTQVGTLAAVGLFQQSTLAKVSALRTQERPRWVTTAGELQTVRATT
jgi:hypothetical protein